MENTIKLPHVKAVAFVSGGTAGGLARMARKTWQEVGCRLPIKSDQYYKMRHEELLSGPLGNEVQRAHWL